MVPFQYEERKKGCSSATVHTYHREIHACIKYYGSTDYSLAEGNHWKQSSFIVFGHRFHNNTSAVLQVKQNISDVNIRVCGYRIERRINLQTRVKNRSILNKNSEWIILKVCFIKFYNILNNDDFKMCNYIRSNHLTTKMFPPLAHNLMVN